MTGAITDVPGIRVGHWTDERGRTGCTVVLCDPDVVGGVEVRGAAPDTTRTDLLDPLATVEHVDAVLLTGGSAFGLSAADGVMRFLEERGVGFHVGAAVVPIVVGAVIFDRTAAERGARPDGAAGYAAASAASSSAYAEGRIGAGAGATIGKLFGVARPGGLGSASVRLGAVTVGALFVVSSLGDVVDERGNAIGSAAASVEARLLAGDVPSRNWGRSTTIGVIATDARLSKRGATLLARAGHDGIARAIRPSHLEMDGDTVFGLATGRVDIEMSALQASAALVAAEAIRRAVR